MTRCSKGSIPRQVGAVVFAVTFLILTTAATPTEEAMRSAESMVLTIGLGATLALFLAASFAWLMRWVLAHSAKREAALMAELKEQRMTFAEALRKMEVVCPLHHRGVDEVFDRELGVGHRETRGSGTTNGHE